MAISSTVNVHNHARLIEAIDTHRAHNRPLLTVMNHTSTLDDPVLLAAILPLRILCSPHMRWALGAADILFTNKVYSAFFGAGRVLRVDRGAGLSQPAMDTALRLMDTNAWLNVFPEGRVVEASSYPAGLGRLRWGIGRLISESARPPLLVPIVHRGMETLFPLGAWLPRLGCTIDVSVGKVIDTADWRGLDNARVTDHVRSSMLDAYP